MKKSLEDLIKTSDELGKPIVHFGPDSDMVAQIYFTVDGANRYEFTLTDTGAG